jgi:hypothetical protein
VITATTMWRRIDVPGHESACLSSVSGQWILAGTALFLHQGSPCRLDYSLKCSSDWQTLSASVDGWIGQDTIEVAISVDASRRWTLNGREVPGVAGCVDIDLNFSPSTNLLPIRRLNLQVGQSAQITAAWLRFPSFSLEPLSQSYHRTGGWTYRYESAGGSFVRDLAVNEVGFIAKYPGVWALEDSS